MDDALELLRSVTKLELFGVDKFEDELLFDLDRVVGFVVAVGDKLEEERFFIVIQLRLVSSVVLPFEDWVVTFSSPSPSPRLSSEGNGMVYF